MGNTGSAHNLHREGVESELDAYYAQQYLRRTAGDARRKGNQSTLEIWSSRRNITECKVLPQPTESLKLRATANGAILQAGGTISFRSKDQSEEKLGLPVVENELKFELQPMRRCHTLILDGQSDSLAQHKTDSPLAGFQRSQTLIHMGRYNKIKSQQNIATVTKLQDELKKRITQTSQNTQLATPKIYKYNKKRKAPPAPTKPVSVLETEKKGKILSVEPKNLAQSKPRIYATNANKASTPQQPQPTRNRISPPFQRCSNVRKSANSLRPNPNSNKNSHDNSRLPYRREKSFDTVLLRHNGCNERSIERKSMPNANFASRENQTHHVFKNMENVTNRIMTGDDSRNKKLTRQNPTNNTINTTLKPQSTKYGNELNPKKEEISLLEPNSDLHDMHIRNSFGSETEITNHNSKTKSREEPLLAERKVKSQQTRIPKLKRTFYFGMKVSNEGVNPNNSQAVQNETHNFQLNLKNENRPLERDDIGLLNFKIEPEEEINDNGILVHVRPTLPRRQPKTPSFSPAAAWRNLLEEQQLLQHERTKQKQTKSNNHVIESPIYLASNHKMNLTSVCNWTPQQDLEDDDDESSDNNIEEENKLGYKRQTSNILHKLDQKLQNRQSVSPLHTFSLSLPRDVHLQCQKKTSEIETEKENNTKTANYWLVPGFNSLQKLKTNLGKNLDSRSQNKCICLAKASNKRNSYKLQTAFGESFSADDIVHHSVCPLHRQSKFHNDNWVLHKSNLNVSTSAEITKLTDTINMKSSSGYLQPKSLKSIYGGKHIVYLPCQESTKNALHLETKQTTQKQQKQTTNKSAYKRQRQEMVRESLQDIIPIQYIHQSNVSIPEKNTHRFSFQSTVRVLEKRRLAEKLSKDAEIQEAQRLHELEAMKRVEEDFQRKRAPEKANLRNQLRLHLKASEENQEYRSLPLNLNDRFENQQQSQQQKVSDVNNNILCRAEPDGAVSPALDFNDNLEIIKHSVPIEFVKRFDFDCDESESETQTSAVRCTAMLSEPFLNTII